MAMSEAQKFRETVRYIFQDLELCSRTSPINVNHLLTKMKMLQMFLTDNAEKLSKFDVNEKKEYVNNTVKVISNILNNTDPAFTSVNPIQHLRNMALDHIYFIGTHQLGVLDEAVLASFFNAFIKLFKEDNEENCLLGFKILLKIFGSIDLAKHLKLIIILDKFCSQIITCYSAVSLEMCLRNPANGEFKSIKTLFENLHSPLLTIRQVTKQRIMILPRALKSLQVLADAPQVLSHVMELGYIGYGCGRIDESWKDLVEAFLNIINLECDEELRTNPNFCKNTYLLFLKLQISSLEFLLYRHLLQSELHKDVDISRLIRGYFNILRSCPTSAVCLRRRLVKVLHVILSLKFKIVEPSQTETKDGFEVVVPERRETVTGIDYLIPFIPNLLSDGFLSGKAPGSCSDERASYCNVLLGFFEKVQDRIARDKILLIVKNLLPVVYDSSLPIQIQNATLRLLMAFQKRRQENVDFCIPAPNLLEMLQAFNIRLKLFIENDLPYIRERLNECETFFDSDDYSCPDFSYYRCLQNPSSNFISDFKKGINKKSIDDSRNHFTIQNCQDLVKNILNGAYEVANQYSTMQQNQSDLNYIQPFSDFLKYSVQAITIYSIPTKSSISADITVKKHHRPLRRIVEIFKSLPPADVPTIFSANIKVLLDETKKEPLLRVFLQILRKSSREFVAVFLHFILTHLEDLDDKENSPALFSVLQDFVEICLKNSDAKEILRPYLLPLIGKCMELTPTAKEHCAFLKVIHLLILAVKVNDAEGDFSRSLLSRFPGFLQTIHFWYKTATDPDLSNLLLRVAITFLSICGSRLMIPNLSIVLMLTVEALNKNVPELTINALKVLQIIEHLDKNFVNSKMSFFQLELSNNLQQTLSSDVDGVAQCSYKLFSKFHSFQHISSQSQIKYEPLTYTAAVNIHFKNDCNITLALDKKLIESTFHIACQLPADSLLQKECLKIIKYYLFTVFNEDCSDLSSKFRFHLSNQELAKRLIDSDFDLKPLDSHRFMLMSLLAIASHNCNTDEINMFFEQCMVHCTIQCLNGAFFPISKDNGIDAFVIVDAISCFLTYSASDLEIKVCIEKCLRALEIFIEVSETIIGTEMWKFFLFEQIWEKVCLCCETAWHKQIFACKAMKLFMNKCPPDWKCNHFEKFINHLFEIVKISNFENSLQCNVCTSVGSILENAFPMIEENLKVVLNPVLEVSIRCLFSSCEAVRNQGMRLFEFLKQISSNEIKLMLPDLPCIKLMLESLSTIDKSQKSLSLKSKIRILDRFLYLLDAWPEDIMDPKSMKCLINSCNSVLDDWLAFSNIPDDHMDFCKRVFKILFFWRKESAAGELLNKALQSDSHEMFSTAFDYCFKLKDVLPIRKWFEESEQTIRIMKEEAKKAEFLNHDSLEYINKICHLCCLFVLLEDNPEEKARFCSQVLLSCLCKSSESTLEFKCRRILKDKSFVHLLLEKLGQHLQAVFFKNCNYCFLNWMLLGATIPRNGVNGNSVEDMYATPNAVTYFAIETVYYLPQYDSNLLKEESIIFALRKIWSHLGKQDGFAESRKLHFPRLKQHIRLAMLLMELYKFSENAEYLFEVLKAPVEEYPEHFRFLTDFLKFEVIEKQSDRWKMEAMVKLLILGKEVYPTDLKITVLDYLIIPSFRFPLTMPDCNEEFQKIVLIIFEELMKSECKIRRKLLELCCLLVHKACDDISEDFRGELKKIAENHVCQYDSGLNCYDPLIKSYWDLLSIKMMDTGIAPDEYSKILRNNLSSYTPDVREVSTCTLDILIPIICSKGGAALLVHWTSIVLEDDSLSVCRIHNEEEECLLRRLQFDLVYHVVMNNLEEYIYNPGFVHLLLDVINRMENIDRVKYICDTFEVILEFVLANKDNINLTFAKRSSLRVTSSSIAEVLFKVPVLKPEISKNDEKSCKKLFDICKKIHYLDSVHFLDLNYPETRLVANILEYLWHLNVSYCTDFILHLQNLDGKMHAACFGVNIMKLFSVLLETSKMSSLLKRPINLQAEQKSDWVKFFKATDAFIKKCFRQPENAVSLDEFPDSLFQGYPFLKDCILDMKEEVIKVKGFMDFMNKMFQNFSRLSAELSSSSKQEFRLKVVAYINALLIRRLLNSEEISLEAGKNPRMLFQFICNSMYHAVGWGNLNSTVTTFPECLNSPEFIKLVTKVLQDHWKAIAGACNTDEEKLIITLQIIESGFLKINYCGEIKKLLVELAKVIQSKQILITILNIIGKWFIKDLLQDNCLKDELLIPVKIVSNRIKSETIFKDRLVCMEHIKIMKLIYNYFENESQSDIFSFDAIVALHSGVPETRIKYIHMDNSLTLNDVIKHLPCEGLWKNETSFSLSHSLELVTSTVMGKPNLAKKQLDINLKDMRAFQEDLCKTNSVSFFDAVLKLSETNDNIPKDLWNNLFPELWSVFLEDSEEKESVREQYEKFIMSTIKSGKTWENKEIEVFIDSFLSSCSIRLFSPSFLKFLGDTPGLSKKIFLKLEDFILEKEFSKTSKSEIYLQLLSKAYVELNDDDLLSGFHQKYSECPELCAGITYQNLGDFSSALDEYKDAMKRKVVKQIASQFEQPEIENEFERAEMNNEFDQTEMDLLKSYRIKCAKNLGDWNNLRETHQSLEDGGELFLSCKYLQRGFQENSLPLSDISPSLEALSHICLEKMKLSPCLFTPKHIQLLQMERNILEFGKIYHLQTFLQGEKTFRIKEIVNIFQSWFSYMPSIKDDLSFWNDITCHRTKQLEFFQSYIEGPVRNFCTNALFLKMKNLVQTAYNRCYISLAKTMLAQGLPTACVKSLQKCKGLTANEENMELYLESLLFEMKISKNDHQEMEIYQAASLFLEETSRTTTTTAVEAMCHVYRGLFLSQANENESTKQSFSRSYETLTDWSKGWLYCGTYYQERFEALRKGIELNIEVNLNDFESYWNRALKSFIMSCKFENSVGSMEPFANIIWLLSHSSRFGLNLESNMVEDISQLPISYWLVWIPQLLAAFLRTGDCHLSYILCNISLKHPESIYFLLHSVIKSTNCQSDEERRFYHPLSKIMSDMEDRHPALISSLRRIETGLIHLSQKIKPNIPGILKMIEMKICDILYLSATGKLETSIDKIMEDMEKNFLHESDPELKKLISDLFDKSVRSLENVLCKLPNYIKLYQKKKTKRSFTHDSRSFLSSFLTEQVQMFSSSFVKKDQPNGFISRILPKVDIIQRNGKSACRIFIESTNGKIYPYAIFPNCSMTTFMKESRVTQFFSFLNNLLQMEKQTSQRSLKYNVPSAIPICARIEIVEDDVLSASLVDILEKNCPKVEENDAMTPFLSLYYEFYRKILSKDDIAIHSEKVFCAAQKHIIPATILKQEFRNRTLSDYYELRKRFSRDISLYYFAQLCFYLSLRIPEKVYVHLDDGKVTNFGFTFNFVDISDPSFSQDVPLITPNISTFITPIGIAGYMKLSISVAARCFYRHIEKVKSVLKAISLNETADCTDTERLFYKNFDHGKIKTFATSVAESVECLADVTGFGGQIDTLIVSSEDVSKLSRDDMSPSYYPWL